MDITGTLLDPYVEVKLGDFNGVTRHLEKIANPVWRQMFAFPTTHLQCNQLQVIVKHKGMLHDDLVGHVVFNMSDIPSRLPPDNRLAPEWYHLSDAHGERFRHGHSLGEIMLAVWLGTHADEAFPEAWHSDVHTLSRKGLTNTRTKVYYCPKLIYLKVAVIAAQDLIGTTEKDRPPAQAIAEIQMGRQIRRTRLGVPQGSANPTWNEEFLFVASEPSEDPLVVTVEEKVDGGRDEPIGRVIIPAAPAIAEIQMGRQIRRTRLGLPQGSANPTWNEEFLFVASEPSEDPLVVTVEEKVDGGRDEPIGRVIIPVPHKDVAKSLPSKWFSLSHVMLGDEAAVDVTASTTLACSKIQLRKLRKSAIGILKVQVLGARGLASGVENPYVVAKHGKKWVRTRTLLNTTAPQWNEHHTWDVFDVSTVITIAVFNDSHGVANDQRIGKVRVRLATLETDRMYTQYYPLMALTPSGLKKTGQLQLAVCFTCKSWAKMLAMYGKPLLPKMHHTNPISELQLDYLRFQAMQMVVTRLGRSEPPLRREVVEYMLDVDSRMFSLRQSKANFYRITSLFSGVVAVGKWFDGICKWKNPLTTILVHVVYLNLVCYPKLILPMVFLCLSMTMAWNYRRRPRKLPHMDAVLSRADLAHPDELDEEFDTFPTSKPSNIVQMRYDRLRSVAGGVQTVLGDLAAQGERAQSLLRWRDPRVTLVFMTLLVMVAVVLYLTGMPYRVVAMVTGLYFLRPPWFRDSTNLFFNFYSRLPSKDDMMI
uniref:C2 domain-containing protein n=1 Tax=Aegilops tauschii TaxID=37682 RepID=M8B6M6_AEGTA